VSGSVLNTKLMLICFLTVFIGCDAENDGGNNMHSEVTQEQLNGLARYRALERESFEASSPVIFERFSEDMILMSAGAPTLRGREAIAQHFSAVWKTHKTRLVEVVDEDVYSAGDAIIAIGRFTLAVSEVGASEEGLSNGRYMAIFKRTGDGEYELWHEVVTDGEPTPAESTK